MEETCKIYVWGADEKDISFLKNFWGEPQIVAKERRSPLDFATELINIPQVEKLNKKEVLQIMELNEKEYKQYKRLINIAARRPSSTEVIKRAQEILKELE
ncbi:MAG: hypothetical protein ACTSPI_13915 [Candidatus Heimdallarchaeaceae archaeon]